MKPLAAAVLLLVALVGAGCGSPALEDTEGAAIGGGVWTEAPEVDITVQAITLEATEAVAAPETFITVESAPVFENGCAQGVHDWQQVYRVQTYIGYPYVELQACSRCGLLRVRP